MAKKDEKGKEKFATSPGEAEGLSRTPLVSFFLADKHLGN